MCSLLAKAAAAVQVAHTTATSALFFDHAKHWKRHDDGDDDEGVLQIPLRNFGNQQYTIHIEMVRLVTFFVR